MIIYLIKNLITEKQYIGKTSNSLFERWSQHKRASGSMDTYLYASMRKHGKENFSIIQIDEASNEERLNELEKFYIKLFETSDRNKGYNLTEGGEGVIPNEETLLKMKSVRRTEEVKNEIRNSVNLLWKDPVYRQNHSEAMARAVVSPEYRLKQSLAKKGNTLRRGTKFSLESKERVSVAQKKRFSDPSQIEKLRLAQKEGWRKRRERLANGT